MKSIPKTDTVGEEKFVVCEQHLIDFTHNGMPRILCTPWLIWFLEHAARNAMLPLLEPGRRAQHGHGGGKVSSPRAVEHQGDLPRYRMMQTPFSTAQTVNQLVVDKHLQAGPNREFIV
jgi:hypothetical protein